MITQCLANFRLVDALNSDLRVAHQVFTEEEEVPSQPSAGSPSSGSSMMPTATSSSAFSSMSETPQSASSSPAPSPSSPALSSSLSNSEAPSVLAAPLTEHSASSEEESTIQAANLSPPDNRLYPTKIVDQLSSASKHFIPSNSPELNQDNEYSMDEGDPELARLKNNLKQVQDVMMNSRRWVNVVRDVITYYRRKIVAAEAGLKQEALEAMHLKKMIVNQHKILAKQRLQAQLDKVTAALNKLQYQTHDVTAKKQDLEAMKRELANNINSIQHQIFSLHEDSAAASPASAADAVDAEDSNTVEA